MLSGMAARLICTDCGEHRFIVERDGADPEPVHCVDCGRPLATSTYADTHGATVATRKLRANIYGAIAGVLFVLVTVSFQATVGGRAAAAIGDKLLIPLQGQIAFAALYSCFSALVIALVCAPIWSLLGRWNITGWRAAMALGFTATLVFWTLYVPLHQPLRDSLKTGIPYAICGALAGLVTWWAGERRSNT
jgi:hypothetical protein